MHLVIVTNNLPDLVSSGGQRSFMAAATEMNKKQRINPAAANCVYFWSHCICYTSSLSKFPKITAALVWVHFPVFMLFLLDLHMSRWAYSMSPNCEECCLKSASVMEHRSLPVSSWNIMLTWGSLYRCSVQSSHFWTCTQLQSKGSEDENKRGKVFFFLSIAPHTSRFDFQKLLFNSLHVWVVSLSFS